MAKKGGKKKKGGGGNQEKGAKKKLEKEKKKYVEQATFGMKNKKKSKKVQKQISELKSNVFSKNKRRGELDEREKKKIAKIAQKQREKELKMLFNVAPSEKELEQKKKEEEEEKKKKELEEKGEVKVTDEEALGLLASIEDEIVEEEDMTLEEVIEKERAKIIEGTPVTLESFQKWKKFKLFQEQQEEDRLRKLEENAWKHKKTGITGRLLFEIDKKVFVDDEEAADVTQYEKKQKEEGEEEEDIDDDLFLDDGEEEENEEEVYDPKTWTLKKAPKALLQEILQKNKKPLPKYIKMTEGGGTTQFIQCNLEAYNKEFLPSKGFPNKKLAENNAALLAYRWLEKELS